MNLTLNLCCNDHRNGMSQGYVENVSLDLPDGESIELHGPRVRVSFIAKTEIRIGRVRVVMIGFGEWVGNWCWNCARVSDDDARNVLNYLKARGWGCECAPTAFFDRWREDGEIEAEEWRALIEGLATEVET